MVFVKLLGAFDLLIAVTLLLLHIDINIKWNLIVVLALLLLFKAYIFKDSWLAYIDGVIALYMLLVLLGVDSFITIIALVIMAYKGAVSFF